MNRLPRAGWWVLGQVTWEYARGIRWAGLPVLIAPVPEIPPGKVEVMLPRRWFDVVTEVAAPRLGRGTFAVPPVIAASGLTLEAWELLIASGHETHRVGDREHPMNVAFAAAYPLAFDRSRRRDP